MLVKQNLENQFFNDSIENQYEEDTDYYDQENEEYIYSELSNAEFNYINETYPGKYISLTPKIQKAPRPISFDLLKNIKYEPVKLEYLYISKKQTPEQTFFFKKDIKNNEIKQSWGYQIPNKETNNKLKDFCFKENEFPLLEAGNTKTKIEEYKKEAESWFDVSYKKKKKVEIQKNIDNTKISLLKDEITICRFDKNCKNIKRLKDGQYINNKDTNKKCKYLHSHETIENFNDRINDIDIEKKETVKEKIKSIVVPILKVFSKIENPWCIKKQNTIPNIKDIDFSIKEECLINEVSFSITKKEKYIFIKAPKCLESDILNMSKKNNYNIKLILY